MTRARFTTLSVWLACACGPGPVSLDAGLEPIDAGSPDASMADAGVVDAGQADAGGIDAGPRLADPFADAVVRFSPGVGAGFGQANLPQVVLGAPHGGGATSGSLDVLSLGREGEIVLEFTDIIAIDGPGVDFTVFENVFSGFTETGVVAASDDGVTWHEFNCAADDVDAGFVGCAGVHSVFSSPENGVSATDPQVSGGDSFDLAIVGLQRARFVRIRDSGKNRFYVAPSGGFDLDAVAVVNGQSVTP